MGQGPLGVADFKTLTARFWPVRALRGRYCPPSARHDPLWSVTDVRNGEVDRRSIKCLPLIVKEIPVKERSPNYGSNAATPGKYNIAVRVAAPVDDLNWTID
jgi:hypothetical protein